MSTSIIRKPRFFHIVSKSIPLSLHPINNPIILENTVLSTRGSALNIIRGSVRRILQLAVPILCCILGVVVIVLHAVDTIVRDLLNIVADVINLFLGTVDVGLSFFCAVLVDFTLELEGMVAGLFELDVDRGVSVELCVEPVTDDVEGDGGGPDNRCGSGCDKEDGEDEEEGARDDDGAEDQGSSH